MAQQGHAFGTCWLIRLLRGLRPDRNPLRRGSDRAETVVLAALLAAFLAGAPFAAGAAGHWASMAATREAQAQRASLTQVTATLVRQAPVLSGYGSGNGAVTVTQGRWRAPDGQARSGEVYVTADALAGGTVRIWVDRAGHRVSPPLTRDQVTGRTQFLAGAAVSGLATLLGVVGWLAHRSLNRRRLAGWDADWLATGPRWSPRRLGPDVRDGGPGGAVTSGRDAGAGLGGRLGSDSETADRHEGQPARGPPSRPAR
jgi:hypothetical protein